MDGTALTGWMYSTTMEAGTPGAPSVAQILGCLCTGALAPKNGCKTAIGRDCVRPPPGPETAQKRLKLAIKTGSGTQNCYFQLDRPAWVSENVFCTPGARKPPPTALPGAKKNPEHPKTLLNHSARNGFWRPQVAARRSNTAPRPIRAAPTVGAPSGACGRTAYAVIPSPTWHLGPDCGAFWPRPPPL